MTGEGEEGLVTGVGEKGLWIGVGDGVTGLDYVATEVADPSFSPPSANFRIS